MKTSLFAKWSLGLCRKNRVSTNSQSVPFGDVVYGRSLRDLKLKYIYFRSSDFWYFRTHRLLLKTLWVFDDERFFGQSTSAGLFILFSLQAVKQCTTSIPRQPDMPLNLQDFSQIAVNYPPTIENSPKFSCINKLNNIKF